MNILSLLSAMLASAFLIGGIYCLTRNRKEALNVFSFLVLLSLGWWNFCYAFFFSSQTEEQAWMWHHLASLGWNGFIALTTYYFVILTGLNQRMKNALAQMLFYLIPTILLVCNLLGGSTSLAVKMVKSTVGNQWGYANSVTNPLMWLYMICLGAYFGFSFFILLRWSHRVMHRMKKVMAIGFVVLDAVTIMLGLITDVLSPLTNRSLPAVANLCTVVFAAGYFLIIVRYDLFNVRHVVEDREIVQHSMDGLMVIDEECEILDVNEACAKLLETENDKLIGHRIYEFFDEKLFFCRIISVLKESDTVNSVEISLIKGKCKKQLMISGSVIRDKKQEYMGTVLSIRDITALYDLNERYKKLAFIDTLTELPNRRKTFEYLKECEEKYHRTGEDFFILYMDLDDFKSINDLYGHNKGDMFLKKVSERLRSFPDDDMKFLGRLSGDEFLIAGTATDVSKNGTYYAAKIAERFDSAFILDNIIIQSGISVGFARYSEFDDVDSMIHHADEQMYKMKQKRKMYADGDKQ